MKNSAWLLAFLLLPQLATAHDYWIESTVLSPANQPRLQSRLYLGDGLKVEEEQPYKPGRASDFRLYVRDESQRDRVIDLRQGATAVRTPMLDMPFTARSGLLRLDRTPAYLDATPADFRHNLEHEQQLTGFAFPLPQKNVRERYTRYLKSLVGNGAGLHARETGQRLEISLLDNPVAASSGGLVRVRVRFEGSALAGAPLLAYRRDARGAITTQELRTDARGQARLQLDGKGLWLVRMMHLRPCARDCKGVEWESFWAAYSFRR